MEQNIEVQTQSAEENKETRNVFIGAKVTPSQKEYIKSQAEKCGMTVSDYLLACAYNYRPKPRLSKEETDLLQNLDNCRSDLVKYTSALRGMSTKQRMILFNQVPFMVGWLKELGNVAESVCQFLNAVKERNKIPSNEKIRRTMIAKAKAISHGINDIRYIIGESAKKKHPEKIYRILDNILPSHLDAMGIWNSMQLTLSRHKPIKNSVIRIELSPSVEHIRFFDIEDWQKLWQDFVAEFDKRVFTGKDGKVRSCQTDLANSKYSVWLHKESAGEVPHLHAAVCRLDEDGNINNDHNIHLRAQRAAERVAKKRGWTTAAEVRIANIHQVNRDCMSILKAMPKWSWEKYKAALIQKGYTVHERLDKKGVLRGYVIRKGNAKYKASELVVARNLMASKLQHTWQKLHHQPNVAMNNIRQPTLPTLADKSARLVEYYTGYRPDTVSYTLNHSGQEQRFYIPEKVLECFNDEFDYRDTENSQELTDMAVALFIGLLGTPNVATGGGSGGSQSDLPWRDKDEDDLQWARRCARAATRTLGKKTKTGFKR